VLRKQAVARIEQLETADSDDRTRDAELSDAVVTDDGGPITAAGVLCASPSPGRESTEVSHSNGPATAASSSIDPVTIS
jgi:hypothetical protein